MGEVAKFVHHHAEQVTPHTLQRMLKKLAMLKVEFTQVVDPKYPHLVDQLEFLSDVVEDFAENKLPDMPYVAVASAAFAILYAHRKFDLVPDFISHHSHADDSAVVRTVLIEYQPVFLQYATGRGLDWSEITPDE
jgi:uncharacterized membrane protein YkvA (DUF1232 family)